MANEKRTAYQVFKDSDGWKRVVMITSVLVLLTMSVGAANMVRTAAHEWFIFKFGQYPYLSADYEVLVMDNSLDRLYRSRDGLLYLIAQKQAESINLEKLGQKLPYADQELVRQWERDLKRVQDKIRQIEESRMQKP